MLMNKQKWIFFIVALIAIGIWPSYKALHKLNTAENMTATDTEAQSYWTCPMHPQIHQDHAGECPICHMTLVKVIKTKQREGSASTHGESRSAIDATGKQLELIGVQKQTVEKMDLTALIPVSGRLISSTTVAFQVYEKDLRYVRAGLQFRGEGSTEAEDEIVGTVTSVDSIIDPTSRTVRVVGNIQNSRGLIAETSFRGEILLALKDRIAIAESAVLHTGQGDLVYIVDSANRLTPKPVKLGIKTEGFYEVLSGLSPGDIISSGPNFLIDSEAKIRGAND